MKRFCIKTLLFSCLILLTSISYAQENEAEQTNKLIKFNSSDKLRLTNAQEIFQDQLTKGSRDYEFKMIATESDQIGFTYQVYQEYYRGLKVEFGIEKLHAKNGEVKVLSGEFYPITNIDINPSLSPATALKSALDHVGAKHYLWENPIASEAIGGYQKPDGELLVLPNFDKAGQLNLAYKFDIYATDPISRSHIYIDAQTGKVLMVNDIIKHLGEHSHGSKGNVNNAASFEAAVDAIAAGNAATRYSGNRTIETRIISGQFALRDNTRGNGVNTYNSGRSNSYPNTNFFDNDNNWTAAEYDNSFKDNGALDAHWGAEATYDYWITQHNRNSFNGNGAAINSWVHYDNQPGGAGYDNAFWNGSVMTYGDGNNFDILTSLDVVAHEIGHAVTTNTANLAYRRESGGMNEGYSDIWGAAVEHFARGAGTDLAPANDVWQIGEDLNGTGGLRSMSNPKAKGDPDTYRGVNWVPATQAEGCATPNRQNDQCGVHSNSGVLNHWFFILVAGKTGTNDVGDNYNVTGIGMTKAAQIAYRNLNVYLGANSTFSQARASGIQSAEDLFGADSPEVIATTNAWYAVGVGDEYNGGGNGGGGTCSTTITSFPYNESFENSIGAWSQSSSDDIDWTVDANGTPSNSTGPASAIAGNFYIYMEVSGNGTGFPNKRAIITSPCFDLPTGASATFNYHMTGNAVGSIALEASTDNGSTWTSVWNQSGDQGGSWNNANVNLGSFGGNTVQLRFNGLSGSSWQGDIAIDNFEISTGGGSPVSGCSGGISSFPYAEGFENTLGAWSQSNSDDINWTLDANGTPSNSTGPAGAVQGSFYAYIEASGNGAGYPNKRAILNSPCFNLSGESAANASFQYHMLGNSVGTLTLEVSTDDGASWSGIWSRSGSQGSAWQSASVDLNAYVGGGIQLRFNGVTSTSWQGDIVIDDFRLSSTSTIQTTSFNNDLDTDLTQEINIFPNPNSGGVLNINGVSSGTQFKLVNAAGQTMLDGEIESNQIDIRSLSAGIYMIQLRTEEEVITKRFIKE